MLPLILISSLSFLILFTMFFLRLFGCHLKNGSVCYSFFKEVNVFLTKQVFLLRKKAKKYRNGLLFFTYIKRFLFYLVVRLYEVVFSFFKKVKLKLDRYFKKIRSKGKNEIVSEYLRNISDYKEGK